VTDPEPARDPAHLWRVRATTVLHRCDWLQLELATVDLPTGGRIQHHAVRVARPAVGVVVHHPGRGVLLLWRHRFIPDAWTYEIPAGRVEADESVEEAARRETREETGWEIGPVQVAVDFFPSIGLSDQRFLIAIASDAIRQGEPTDRDEAAWVGWVPLPQLRDHLRRGRVRGGLSLTALLYALALGPLAAPAGRP